MAGKELWQIEVYDGKIWIAFGSPSKDYSFAYSGMKKLADTGYKVRLRKVAT